MTFAPTNIWAWIVLAVSACLAALFAMVLRPVWRLPGTAVKIGILAVMLGMLLWSLPFFVCSPKSPIYAAMISQTLIGTGIITIVLGSPREWRRKLDERVRKHDDLSDS